MTARLLVVGGGNMGSALVRGLLNSGWQHDAVVVCEADETRRSSLRRELPGTPVTNEPISAEGVVIAVKPVDGEDACRRVSRLDMTRLVSVMAGVRTARLESWLGGRVAVVRAMPNTPALVGAAMTALAPGSTASEADLDWASEILSGVGRVLRIGEASMDAVTALSGSGPGYFFYVVEAMIEAGVSAGLTDSESRALVVQTFEGSARLLAETGERPEVLRARVTSPGGTTAAGIGVLSERDLAGAFEEAVQAATARSRELGS